MDKSIARVVLLIQQRRPRAVPRRMDTSIFSIRPRPLSSKNMDGALSVLPSYTGSLSRATYVSLSTQTPPRNIAPSMSNFKNSKAENLHIRYPGQSLGAAAKQLGYVKEMVEYHESAFDSADEVYDSFTSEFGEEGVDRLKAMLIPGLAMLRDLEDQMLLQVQDLQLEVWREWYLLESETWPKFPQFTKLPPEIRHQIWCLSLKPRIIQVSLLYHFLLDH